MSFEYQILGRSPLDIRLLKILPVTPLGKEKDILSLQLSQSPLEEAPPYLALSYTWGRLTMEFPEHWDDPTSRVPILIDGKQFSVRQNLYAALKTFRGMELYGPWWVDAICIDQENIFERNWMVHEMTRVYSRSADVCAWLGPATALTPVAFHKARQLSRSWEQRSSALQSYSFSMRGEWWTEYEEVVSSEFPDAEPVALWGFLIDIWCRSWWERAWIIQEVCAASSLVLVAGEEMIHWSELSSVLRTILQHNMLLGRVAPSGSSEIPQIIRRLSVATEAMQSLSVCTVRRIADREEGRESSLLENLKAIRPTQCKDPRDKVYAAFGFSDPAETIRVDYDLRVQDVYVGVARRSIEVRQGFEILSFCRYPPCLENLPSWTPDWTDHQANDDANLPQRGRSTFGLSESSTRTYSASGDSSMNVHFEDGGYIMVLDGFYVGIVGFVSSSHSLDQAEAEEIARYEMGVDAVHNTSSHKSIFQRVVLEGIAGNCDWLRQWATVTAKGSGRGSLIEGEDWVFLPEGGKEQFEALRYIPSGENLLQAYIATLFAGSITTKTESKALVEIRWKDLDDSNRPHDNGDVEKTIASRCSYRALAVLNPGYLALVPMRTQIDDIVCILAGSDLPLILRRHGSKFKFIGQCYVHGIMDGELWEFMTADSDFTSRKFRVC